MNQLARNKVFHNFRLGKGRCLVSSDLCTRGIDIPAVNETAEGTVSIGLPLDSETNSDPVGTGVDNVNVAVALAPPTHVVGFATNDLRRESGYSVNEAGLETPPTEAVRVTKVLTETL